MKTVHKGEKWNETDYNYWKKNGWLDGKSLGDVDICAKYLE